MRERECAPRSTGRAIHIQRADDLLSVRKKLGLDQKEAAAMFGGGVNAFSRYERGKISPPKSLEVLFEMIEKRPELGEFAKECAANVDRRKGGSQGQEMQRSCAVR